MRTLSYLRLALVAPLLFACSDDGSQEPITSTAQEIRISTGTDGQAYLGVDLLVTDEQRRGVPCGQGNVDVTFELSRHGPDGPWVAAGSKSVQLSCNDGRGDLAMVVDNSGSLDTRLSLVQQGVSAVAERLLYSGGRMSLVRVSTDATIVSRLTNSRDDLDAAISSLRISNGWTALWDGIRMANETLGLDAPLAAREIQPSLASFCSTARKRAIVLFTDGQENNSSNQKHWTTTYAGDGIDTQLEDLELLRVAGVSTPIYAVGLGAKVAAS